MWKICTNTPAHGSTYSTRMFVAQVFVLRGIFMCMAVGLFVCVCGEASANIKSICASVCCARSGRGEAAYFREPDENMIQTNDDNRVRWMHFDWWFSSVGTPQYVDRSHASSNAIFILWMNYIIYNFLLFGTITGCFGIVILSHATVHCVELCLPRSQLFILWTRHFKQMSDDI